MKVEKYLQYSLTITLFAISFILFIQASNANIIDNPQSTDLFIEYQTKTKPNAEPKLSSDISLGVTSLVQTDAVKYASVSFISRRSNIKMKDVGEGDNLDESPINKIECPVGQEDVDGVCINVTSCAKDFPLPSASKNVGVYVTKNCGSKGIGYCYTECSTGWTHSDCYCNAAGCEAYPLSQTTGQNCNGISSCKTGDSYKYKCTGCATGYTLLSSGVCVDAACSEYGAGYFGNQTEHCKLSDVKRNGEKYCYKCTSCEEGWELSSSTGLCSEIKCNYVTSQISNCISYQSIIKSGENFCYKCGTCADGYKLNSSGTSCTAKSCSGATSMSALANCANVVVERAGTGFCYKCQ